MKYILPAALALTLILPSCSGKEEKAAVAKEELPMVTVDIAHRLDVPQSKTYTASVEAENVNNIAPQQPNRIKSINVDAGDHVRAGQELVVLDMAGADQLRINLEQIEREYNRAVKLLEIGCLLYTSPSPRDA